MNNISLKMWFKNGAIIEKKLSVNTKKELDELEDEIHEFKKILSEGFSNGIASGSLLVKANEIIAFDYFKEGLING